MAQNQQISVLGCGWLGFALAQEFIKVGFKVKGSTTTKAKLTTLENAGILPFCLDLLRLNTDDLSSFVQGSEILIITVPPRSKLVSFDDYLKSLSQFLTLLNKDLYVILISSTSVYPNINDWVNEEMNLKPDTQRGRQMNGVEELFLQKRKKDSVCIVRMGGLVGYDRHPGRFLSGKRDLPNAQANINIIHRDDAVGLVLQVIHEKFWGEVVNGVANYHPTRAIFYKKASDHLGCTPPEFINEKECKSKKVSNEKSIEKLGYSYKKEEFGTIVE